MSRSQSVKWIALDPAAGQHLRRLACSHDRGCKLETTADYCVAFMPSRTLSNNIAADVEEKAVETGWRQRVNSLGSAGLREWRDGGLGKLRLLPGWTFPWMYRRTNQGATRQTLSKTVFSPTAPPKHASVSNARGDFSASSWHPSQGSRTACRMQARRFHL